MRASALRTAAAAFAVSRILVFLVVYWTAAHEPSLEASSPSWHGAAPAESALVDPWRRWDALWFINVAREGYWSVAGRQSNITLFPLLPAVLRAGAPVSGSGEWLALLINNGAFFLSLLLLYRLAREEYGEEVAARACWCLVLFPTSFVLSGIYSESLCLLATLAAFSAAGRGRSLAAGLAGAAAALSRVVGAAAFPALLFEGGPLRTKWRARIPLLLIPAALLSFFLFLYAKTGSPTAYFDNQLNWSKNLAWPFYSVVYELSLSGNRDQHLINAGSILLFSALALFGFDRLRRSHAIYLALGVLVPLCQSTLTGAPRYMLVLFPAYFLMGMAGRSRPLYWLWLIGSAALSVYVCREFTAWRYSL